MVAYTSHTRMHTHTRLPKVYMLNSFDESNQLFVFDY